MDKESELKPDINEDEAIIDDEMVEFNDTEDNESLFEPIIWSSTDNSSHQRGNRWYIMWILVIFTLAVISLAVQLLFNTWQIWTTVGLAIVVFISLIVVNKQPSQTIKYKLTDNDVTINDKSFPLSDFQSFSITDHGDTQAISLIPIKRVSIPHDLIIPTKDAGIVVDILNSHMPMNQVGLNFTEKISSFLKF